MQIQGQSLLPDITQNSYATSGTTPGSTSATSGSDSGSSSGSTSGANPSIDGLANENTFLQLLVAQIKNQDPLNPADSVQFLSQLAQFSQLEQLIGIRQELQPTTSSSSSTTNQNGGTNATTGTTN